MATTKEQTLINVCYARKVGEGAYCFSPVLLFVRPHKCIISIFIFLNFSQNDGLLKLVHFFFKHIYNYVHIYLCRLTPLTVFKLDFFFTRYLYILPVYQRCAYYQAFYFHRVVCCWTLSTSIKSLFISFYIST